MVVGEDRKSGVVDQAEVEWLSETEAGANRTNGICPRLESEPLGHGSEGSLPRSASFPIAPPKIATKSFQA